MRAVFGIALAVGFVGLLGWIAAVAVSESVDGWSGADPDARFGPNGRRVVAAIFGFGMAGLSAAYAGWPMAVATGAALVGGGVAAFLATAR